KAGCHALSRSLAAEYSDKSIRANVIVPGQVTTRFGLPSDAPQSEDDLEVIRARGRQLSPMERAGEAEDVANLALFLASDDSSYITGQEFVIDGGMTAVNHWIRAIREG
ncbi:MAG: SDR family oxidoreductase, partial [Chloroflexi bacterium]|nr:SDR family oxidoreductase [Chloroflexota bacterium]